MNLVLSTPRYVHREVSSATRLEAGGGSWSRRNLPGHVTVSLMAMTTVAAVIRLSLLARKQVTWLAKIAPPPLLTTKLGVGLTNRVSQPFGMTILLCKLSIALILSYR